MISAGGSDEGLKLTAHRPEPHRFRRLADVLERAERAIQAADQLASWQGALRQLDDSKGDLTAVWRADGDRTLFASFIDRAWSEVGEDGDDVVHSVLQE